MNHTVQLTNIVQNYIQPPPSCFFQIFRRSFKLLLINLTLIALSSPAYAILPIAPCNSLFARNLKLPKGGHTIQVTNKLIYYRLLEQAKPVIVFSSGTGFPAAGWYESGITKALSKKLSVFTYDRIYTFNSCPNDNDYMPNTAKDVVERLRKLLRKANLKPPYILVGHSFGGLYMLYYARQYPKEVKGLLLMDATSSAGPTPLPKESLPILKRNGNPQNYVATNPLYNEGIGQLPSYLQIKNLKPLPESMPLVVMYATKHCLPTNLTEGKLMCMTKAQEKKHVEEQFAIYNMSKNHALYKVDGTHMSFFDPEKHKLVMEALHRLIKMVLQQETR